MLRRSGRGRASAPAGKNSQGASYQAEPQSQRGTFRLLSCEKNFIEQKHGAPFPAGRGVFRPWPPPAGFRRDSQKFFSLFLRPAQEKSRLIEVCAAPGADRCRAPLFNAGVRRLPCGSVKICVRFPARGKQQSRNSGPGARLLTELVPELRPEKVPVKVWRAKSEKNGAEKIPAAVPPRKCEFSFQVQGLGAMH